MPNTLQESSRSLEDHTCLLSTLDDFQEQKKYWFTMANGLQHNLVLVALLAAKSLDLALETFEDFIFLRQTKKIVFNLNYFA